MKNLKLITILLITFFAFSCKKDKTNNTDKPASYVLAPKSVIIDNPSSQVIQTVDSTKVVFNGNTTQLQSLTVGNIIISGIAPNAPYGFLRKITNIQKTGTTYIFTTVEVPLEEAFEELHVDYTKSFTTADTAHRVTSTNFTVDMPNIVLYDADGNNSTTTDQIKLSENIELTPSFRFAVDISRFKLQYAILEGNFQTVLDQSVVAGGTVGNVSKEINIYEQPLATYPLPGLPFLVVVPNLRVSLGANANLNVSVTASQTITSNVKANIEYKNNNWDKNYTQTLSTTHTTPSINGSATAKIYVEPAIDFKLYNSNWAKGSVLAQGYLKASGTLLPTPDCELKAGLSAGAEANLQFFSWNFVAASYPDIFDYSKVLYTCNNASNPPVADFSASQTNINTGSSIGFTDLSSGSPTSWSWTFQGGTPATSTAQNPTVQYNTAGTYTVTLTATNANGSNTKTKTAYIVVNNSNSIFNPNLTYGTMTDIDGNIYKTIQIGTQTWMAENLKTTHYNDGTIIPNITDNTAWNNLTTGGWCYYNNDVSNNTIYGKLYNWYSVNTGKLAPTGWHVPTDAEWTTLINYLGGESIAGGKMKSTSSLWNSPNTGATNSSGFSGLPTGGRNGTVFIYIGEETWIWSSTEYAIPPYAYLHALRNVLVTSKRGHDYKFFGFSVRCIKD
ncbi:MAG: PKD domain-containing protein [Chitinophagales bacterium]|nr:PKD domain-containing protein [Chitinophagales bacterium]